MFLEDVGQRSESKETQSDQWCPATRLTTSRSDCDRSPHNELDFILPMKIAPRLCQTAHKLLDGKVIRLYFQQAIWEGGSGGAEVCQTAFANDDVRRPYLISSDKRTGGISAGRQISELTAEVYQKRISKVVPGSAPPRDGQVYIKGLVWLGIQNASHPTSPLF